MLNMSTPDVLSSRRRNGEDFLALIETVTKCIIFLAPNIKILLLYFSSSDPLLSTAFVLFIHFSCARLFLQALKREREPSLPSLLKILAFDM